MYGTLYFYETWKLLCLPSGSWGMPLKMMRYVVRKSAPSAGRMWGPPRRPPVASSLPSGSRSTRSPSETTSSPGSSAGRRIFGWGRKNSLKLCIRTDYLSTSTSEPKLRHFSLTRRNPELSICVTESDAGNKFIIIMSNQSTTWPCWMRLNLKCTSSTKAWTPRAHQPSRNSLKPPSKKNIFRLSAENEPSSQPAKQNL